MEKRDEEVTWLYAFYLGRYAKSPPNWAASLVKHAREDAAKRGTDSSLSAGCRSVAKLLMDV